MFFNNTLNYRLDKREKNIEARLPVKIDSG